MQILGAAHLFSWLIGYEFYRNDHTSNLGVITGGTQINRAQCANVEEFGNLIHTDLTSAHGKSVTRSQNKKVSQLKDCGRMQSWSHCQIRQEEL